MGGRGLVREETRASLAGRWGPQSAPSHDGRGAREKRGVEITVEPMTARPA